MSNLFTELNKGIDLLLGGEVQEASKVLKDIYLKSKDFKEDSKDFKDNYIILLSALGEIDMKNGDYNSSLGYYSEANELSDGKNFNLLFNLGIIYNNLGKREEGESFIKKAQSIESNNEYLVKYLDNNNDKSEISKLYLISGVLGFFGDISNNMIRCILSSDILFVEEIDVFNSFINENKIDFKGKVYELGINNIEYNELILDTFLKGKNIGIFESSGIPCFVDPGLDVLQYVYELKNKGININIVYVPGGSALTAALSLSGFNIDKFSFMHFLSSKSKQEVLSSQIPVVYFFERSDFHVLLDYLSFMKDITDKKVFCGINISKGMVKFGDVIIRDTYRNAYLEIEEIYKECLDLGEVPDFVFVFNK